MKNLSQYWVTAFIYYIRAVGHDHGPISSSLILPRSSEAYIFSGSIKSATCFVSGLSSWRRYPYYSAAHVWVKSGERYTIPAIGERTLHSLYLVVRPSFLLLTLSLSLQLTVVRLHRRASTSPILALSEKFYSGYYASASCDVGFRTLLILIVLRSSCLPTRFPPTLQLSPSLLPFRSSHFIRP